MGYVKWLVYILSFFLPVFGFVTFWVNAGREGELGDVAKNSMLASFAGVVLLVILGIIGVSIFDIPWGSPIG